MDQEEFQQTRFLGISGSWVSRACRYALSPLTGRGGLTETNSEAGVLAALSRLHREWVARAGRLRRAGWWQAEPANAMWHAAYCPAPGVLPTPRGSGACRLYRVCPWCWCREHVYKLWNRLDALLYPPAPPGRKVLPEVDLVEVSTKRWYPVDRFLITVPFDWASNCRDLYLKKHLRRAYGAYILCTIEPPNLRAKRPAWCLHHRLLAVVPMDSPSPPTEYTAEPKITVTRRVRRTPGPGPKRRNLAAAVGRTCLYPSLLMRGPLEETLDVLRLWSRGPGRPGVRLAASYGVLRKLRSAVPIPSLTMESGMVTDDQPEMEDEDAPHTSPAREAGRALG